MLSRLDYGRLDYGAKLKQEISADVEEARHPTIGVHEASGQEIHMISPDTSNKIEGYADAESEALIAEVAALVATSELVYRHTWRKGDLLVWDNTLLQHARTSFPSSARRTLRRCAIASDHEQVYAPG